MTIRTVAGFNDPTTGVLKDNVAGEIGESDVRDIVESTMLEQSSQAPTASNITGAAGKHYLIDQATNQSANIDLTLPNGAAAGSKIRVTITAGDDTYAVIIKGAASTAINGGTDNTEWSRLFITGESVLFESDGTDWWVVQDGRIACRSTLVNQATWTHTTIDAWEHADFTSGDGLVDVGNIIDLTLQTNRGGVVIRRASDYRVVASTRYRILNSGIQYGATFAIDGVLPEIAFRALNTAGGTGVTIFMSTGLLEDVSVGTEITSYAFQSDSSSEDAESSLQIEEILK